MFKAHIKLSVLEELSGKSLSGYDLMKSMGERRKKPSPGYIYPLLNDLEKKNFISVKKDKRRKVYSITQKGRKFLKNLKGKQEDMLRRMVEIWEPIAEKKEISELKNFKLTHGKDNPFMQDGDLIERLRKAIFSFYGNGKNKKRNAMKKILEETIKKLGKIK